MNLKTWLEAETGRARRLAEAVGVSEPHISMLRHGKTKCSLSLAIAIAAATEGEVSLHELEKGPLSCDESNLSTAEKLSTPAPKLQPSGEAA